MSRMLIASSYFLPYDLVCVLLFHFHVFDSSVDIVMSCILYFIVFLHQENHLDSLPHGVYGFTPLGRGFESNEELHASSRFLSRA
jgi:hypothetical protein